MKFREFRHFNILSIIFYFQKNYFQEIIGTQRKNTHIKAHCTGFCACFLLRNRGYSSDFIIVFAEERFIFGMAAKYIRF